MARVARLIIAYWEQWWINGLDGLRRRLMDGFVTCDSFSHLEDRSYLCLVHNTYVLRDLFLNSKNRGWGGGLLLASVLPDKCKNNNSPFVHSSHLGPVLTLLPLSSVGGLYRAMRESLTMRGSWIAEILSPEI